MVKLTIEERFWSKVDSCGVCWEWTASRKSNGYGQFGIGRKNVAPHRFAYTLLIGPIPEGKYLDHLCRNRGCVNPDHLDVVTHKVNVLRGEGVTAQNARKTHCLRNHELSGANLIVKQPQGWRTCRKCIQIRKRNKRRKDK